MSNVFLTENRLRHEIAFAFRRSAASVAVHAYPADHPLGMPGQPSIHIGIPLRPRGRCDASWTKHPLPERWQIMALHEAHTGFLDAIITELRDKLTSYDE